MPDQPTKSFEAVYFVVRRRAGVEHACIILDQLPDLKSDFTRVWAIRTDTLEPEYARVSPPERPIGKMLPASQRLRDLDQLPAPNLTPPATKSGGRTALYGEGWRPPEVPWDRNAPADPDYSGYAAEK